MILFMTGLNKKLVTSRRVTIKDASPV